MSVSRRHFLAAAAAAAAGTRAMSAPAAPNPVPKSIGRFGLDLYAKLRSKSGNVFFSPFSISTCLSMTAAGAKGATRDQMASALRLPADGAATDAGFKSLLAAVNGKDKRGYQLSTANAIWMQQGYGWRSAFQDRVVNDYRAGLHSADFRADPEVWRLKINGWVEKETRDRIKDLLPQGTVTPRTRMVLANAVYFKGDWATPFEPKRTQDAPFTAADGTRTSVPMMHRVGTVRLYQDDAVQVAELPYQGDEVTMTVVLPRKADGLPAVEDRIAAAGSAAGIGLTRPAYDVRLYLPRFKVETEYELTPALKALGMTAAFDGSADFSGMIDGREHLHISAVAHKAFVEVNEEGTEAAAATGVVMRATAAPVGEPPTFRADRPFLFLIRHVPTDTVLFQGRYEKP
jgi:serpin B